MRCGQDLNQAAGCDLKLAVRTLALEVSGFVAIYIVVHAAANRLRLHLQHVPRASLARKEPRSQPRQMMRNGDRTLVFVAGPVDHVITHTQNLPPPLPLSNISQVLQFRAAACSFTSA